MKVEPEGVEASLNEDDVTQNDGLDQRGADENDLDQDVENVLYKHL